HHQKYKNTVLRFFFGLLAAALVMLLISNNGILFLISWEFMAISAVFLINMDDTEAEVRGAAWLYFVTTRLSTMCIIALLLLWNATSGSFDMVPIKSEVSELARFTFFSLTILAFGIKAGIMPLHIWLPPAHASAPSHISAMLSGVVIKMGVYGLLRFLSLLPGFSEGYGYAILTLGGISAVMGVCFALGQHDLKRLLAYHSIENIGIIFMGIGIALIGGALGEEAWIVLGISAALLHTWNHCLFKSVLFFGAGAVIMKTKTRLINEMGGLAKHMPITAILFFFAALAISGLPPLNGFVSELLVYIGLFRSLGIMGDSARIAMTLFAPLLAITGALALACFVKVYGTVFLGEPRSVYPSKVQEPSPSIYISMAVLVAACFIIGLIPAIFSNILNAAVCAWSGGEEILPDVSTLAPLHYIGICGTILILACLTCFLALVCLLGSRPIDLAPTWGCGYSQPTARMQYTSSSFAQVLVESFSWALRPKVKRTSSDSILPGHSAFEIHVADVVLDKVMVPLYRNFINKTQWFHWIQNGYLHLYLVYIFLILAIFLLI
ncbi:MAG: hydrogenase, partial [Oligoflexales bacterium]|nr:hydrogenase [Oligoflexales bacterium]